MTAGKCAAAGSREGTRRCVLMGEVTYVTYVTYVVLGEISG